MDHTEDSTQALKSQIEQARAEFALLAGLFSSLGRSLNAASLVREIAHTVWQLTGAAEVRLRYKSPGDAWETFALEQGLEQKASWTCTALAQKLETSGRHVVLSGDTGEEGLKSYLGLPLIYENQVIGTLEAGNLPVPDRLDDYLQTLQIVSDVSALALANARLFEKTEATALQWVNTFNSMSDGVSIHSPDFRIILANKALGEMLGTTPEALIGQHCFRAAHGADQPITGCPVSCLKAGGETTEVVRLEPHLGNRWVQIRCDPILDHNGRLISIIHVVRDITQRKKAEEAIRQKTEELARSNADLEQFAYIASHDLQEPLRMVSSYVQLLGERYKGKLDQDADDFIGYAHDGATRMQQLINDLLRFSRVGTRGGEFRLIELEDVFAQAVENLKITIEEKDAKITHGPLPQVYGDGRQLTQVMQNLIENAVKFRGSTAPEAHVFARTQGNECLCCVKDNGIGIAPEHHKKLFLLFQRLHSRREYPGTGIGLAICKRVVERHGGKIWVESAAGEGSTFCFTIPLRKE